MKKILVLLFLYSNLLYSQVGISTTTPTATLDINGDLEIVNTPVNNVSNSLSSENTILVKDLNSNQVQAASIKNLINNHLKSLIKGSKSSSSQIALITSGGTSQIINFDTLEVDTNNEYSTSNNKFTPKQDGWYDIQVQVTIEPTNPLSVTLSNDFRLNIVKNGATILASHRGLLATIAAIGTDVFIQPNRTVKTMTYLTTSDYIQFEIQNNNSLLPVAIDVTLLTNSNQSYFTIKQIK